MLEIWSLILLYFGYLVAGFAVLGLLCWAVIAVVPDMRGDQTEAFHGLGRMGLQWLGLGLFSIAVALLARSLHAR